MVLLHSPLISSVHAYETKDGFSHPLSAQANAVSDLAVNRLPHLAPDESFETACNTLAAFCNFVMIRSWLCTCLL